MVSRADAMFFFPIRRGHRRLWVLLLSYHTTDNRTVNSLQVAASVWASHSMGGCTRPSNTAGDLVPTPAQDSQQTGIVRRTEREDGTTQATWQLDEGLDTRGLFPSQRSAKSLSFSSVYLNIPPFFSSFVSSLRLRCNFGPCLVLRESHDETYPTVVCRSHNFRRHSVCGHSAVLTAQCPD